MALIQQGVDSVFETDKFVPLIQLGERALGPRWRRRGDRALRILADHTRGMSFLVADGVVPSNEDRGYVLRKVMRRAIHQGRRIGIEGAFLTQYADLVRELMGAAYPELLEQRESVDMWLAREEEAFGRTIEQGQRLLDDMIERASTTPAPEGIGADNAFLLHDTYGFPFELTVEIAAEQGLGTDAQGFEELMDQQRARARAGAGRGGARRRCASAAREFAGASAATDVHRLRDASSRRRRSLGRAERRLVKLAESPFYAEGGGQVSDSGDVSEDGDAARGHRRRARRRRPGAPGRAARRARAGRARHRARGAATAGRPSATTRRRTCCTRRCARRSAAHVRQAGSYVGPDKLRFDFTHGAPLTPEELRAVEDRVNEEILANRRCARSPRPSTRPRRSARWRCSARSTATSCGWSSVGDGTWSRELCGGTHVRSTAEIGVLQDHPETSSAANVRRIEAVTGPAGVQLLLRPRPRARGDRAALRKTAPENAAEAADAARRQAQGGARSSSAPAAELDTDGAEDIGGVQVLVDRRSSRRRQGAARARRPRARPARRGGGRRARRGRRRQGRASSRGDARRRSSAA